MILRFSKHFLRNYSKAPKAVQEAFDKQSQFLLQDLHHPSLHAKKYDEARDLWQARVNYTWRFYFKIVGNVYLMQEITTATRSFGARLVLTNRSAAALTGTNAPGRRCRSSKQSARKRERVALFRPVVPADSLRGL